MRWGIREDAGIDHTTTDICLQEVRKCQQISRGPNFVVSVCCFKIFPVLNMYIQSNLFYSAFYTPTIKFGVYHSGIPLSVSVCRSVDAVFSRHVVPQFFWNFFKTSQLTVHLLYSQCNWPVVLLAFFTCPLIIFLF